MSSQPDPASEWWTTTDVAAFLNIRVATVSTYRKRGQMPPPDMQLGRTHAWRPRTITEWHAGRGEARCGWPTKADTRRVGAGAGAERFPHAGAQLRHEYDTRLGSN